MGAANVLSMRAFRATATSMPDVVNRPDRRIAVAGKRMQRLRDLRHLASHFGELIDHAALDPELWPQIAEELCRLNPGVRIVIQAHDPSFGRPLVALGAGWSDGYVEKYNRHLAYLNQVSRIWANTAPMLTPVLLPEFALPMSEFLRSEFYNEGLKAEGEAECATGMRLLSEGKRQATLAIQYGLRHKDEMHGRLLPLLQQLGPRLRGALLANRHTIRQKQVPLKADLIHSLVDPALIVDKGCRVIAANQPALDLIASSETLRIGVHDALSFGERQTDMRFAGLVHDSCLRAPGSSGYLEFDFVHGDSRFRAAILPIARGLDLSSSGLSVLFGSNPAVLLVLRCELSARRAKDFQLRFQLTDAELRIVQALSKEGSIVEIAERLGVAYETARNQLKAAFRKTGTHSQRELVSLLMQK